MPSRADTHDLDKLRRWQKDLAEDSPDAPAVYAVFLVSNEDTVAHDLFRAFRSAFEERGAGFAHLVIFGQHGVSETATRVRAELDLPDDGQPALALLGGDLENGEYLTLDRVSLPQGNSRSLDTAAAYWLTAMYLSDWVMEVTDFNDALTATADLIDDPPEDFPTDGFQLAERVLADLLEWVEFRIEGSRETGSPAELNLVLKKRLTDLCAAVVEQLEQRP